MNSIGKIIILLIIIGLNFKIQSQTIDELPMSIYFVNTEKVFYKSNMDELNFMGYPFRFIDKEDIRSNLYNISFNNIGRKSTIFDYDSYHSIIFNETQRYYDPNIIAILPKSMRNHEIIIK